MRKIVDAKNNTVAGKRFEVARMAQILEDAYLSSRRPNSDRAKKSFAPSSLGYGAGTCPRRWFYDFSGGFNRIDDSDSVGIANMAYGTEAHARIQGLFETAGLLIEAERKVVTDGIEGAPPIFGFADLVIKWQGEEVVGEIKTTGQESFVAKKSKNQPAGYHLLQVLIYMKALNLNKGFLLYENKNTQELLIIPVVWNVANKKLVNDAWEWMNLVYDNWSRQHHSDKVRGLPKRPFRSAKSVVCKTCPFQQYCWSDEEGVVDLPVLEVLK